MQIVIVMPSLLEKAINCYDQYLKNLNYGITNQKYCMLYEALVLLKYDINDKTLLDYYSSHLNCPININLVMDINVKNMITWTINRLDSVADTFEWNNIDISTTNRYYTVTTNSVSGYNYFYLTIPQNQDFMIYDEMNNLLFDTKNPNTNFVLRGTVTTSENQTNLVYMKSNMFNTVNQVNFNIKLYQ